MIPSWAKVGAKVVCVDASAKGWLESESLKEGVIYTITRAWFDGAYFVMEFDELKRSRESQEAWGADVGYNIRRFRPLITQKDDISLFTHLLNTTSEDQLIKEGA